MKKLAEFIGSTVLFVTTIGMAAIVNGFVVSFLWKWFITPVFNAPIITVAQSTGIFLIMRTFVGSNQKDKKPDENLVQLALDGLGKSLVIGSCILLTGWIVHLFL